MMRTLASALLAAVLLAGPPARAQAPRPQEILRILGIAVEGNTTADPAAVIANAGLKVGEEFVRSGDKISGAVRRLWALGIFDDVRIAVDRRVGDGVYLLVTVRELPRFEGAEVSGDDEMDADDILKKVTLERGEPIPPYALARIRRQVERLYEEEGFLLARVQVTAAASDTAPHRATVKVEVDEGPEVEVARIMFEGNVAFSEGDLRGEMEETSEKSWWKFWTSASFDRKKYEEDKRLLATFYRRNGFRDAQVLSDSIWYGADREEMFILIRLYEGPRYVIRSVAWEGNTIYPDSILGGRLGIAPGEIYNAEKLEQNLRGNEAQTDVASLYLDNGYLTFNLEPREIVVPPDSVDIRVLVFERNQFRIGHVHIKGNTKTHDKVIRRELYTRPGDFFSRAAIVRSARQIAVLNYFNPEKIKPDYNLVDDKTVDITYEVEEKSTDNVNASIGYSGAFGVTGALGFTINNFSISEPLTGGAGQILNFEWQFGTTTPYRTFTLGFTEPWLFGTPTLLGVSLFDTRQAYTFDLKQTGGSLRVGRRFRWPDDYFRGDWILNAQHNDVINGRGIYLEGPSSQVSLTQIITRNSVDNPVFPTSGSNLSLSTELSGGPFLPGTIDFHKWEFTSEWYLPLFGSSRVSLYLGSQYGYIGKLYGETNIPPIELFFMGGTGLGFVATTPLRGYDDQTIGPRNASGDVTGGYAMTRQTAEFRVALALSPIPIYLLGFAEGGNVFTSLSRADFFDLKRSAGFGARLQIMPIGLIGFDYGFGFDDVDPADGRPDGWRFHFVFGRGF
ncbi:MAG: outer membrane protein assembly factor BamA [Bacteroidota bacterium]